MDKFVIRGGEPLLGTVHISGAKKRRAPLHGRRPSHRSARHPRKIFRRSATSRPLETCSPPWVPKSNWATDAPHHRTSIHCATLSHSRSLV